MLATEITVLTKSGGPLTKRISLAADGTLQNDSSACTMSRGQAQRAPISGISALADLITTLTSTQAIALGTLRADLPDRVQVVTKRALNGQTHVIARTADYIKHRAGQAAWALLDFDSKGMPVDVATAIEAHGSWWRAMVAVLPALESTTHLLRRSTSAGLYRADTKAKLPSSGGLHAYLAVKDGTDVERFLQVLHARAWLAGFGWLMVGAGGQLLERSIIDRMVGAPERLVFEGAPILEPPLQQDRESRRPVATDGDVLDTLAACPPLTIAEAAKLRELKARDAQRLAPESAKARAAFIADQVKRMVDAGVAEPVATRTVARQCDGVLLPDLMLPFDDSDLAGATVADVLADPEKFEGATLADPLEGVDYGRGKAKIMRRADGTPWINSFAHGRTVYELKLNAAAVRAAMERADRKEAVAVFVKFVLAADLDTVEQDQLRELAAERSGCRLRVIDAMLNAAKKEQAARQAKERQQHKLAERRDPRPQIESPELDDPWLPQMGTLNDVLGKSTATQPPARDVGGVVTQWRKIRVPDMHALIQAETNADQDETATRLPAPEQWLLTRMSEIECAEMIEEHIDYIDKNARSVHLPMPFVRHFMTRHDNALPTVAAIATLPIVLPARRHGPDA